MPTMSEPISSDFLCIGVIPGRACRGYNESNHVVYDADLKASAKLHRFLNPAGCAYSAIYVDGEEIWSCERDYEAQMISNWNASR